MFEQLNFAIDRISPSTEATESSAIPSSRYGEHHRLFSQETDVDAYKVRRSENFFIDDVPGSVVREAIKIAPNSIEWDDLKMHLARKYPSLPPAALRKEMNDTLKRVLRPRIGTYDRLDFSKLIAADVPGILDSYRKTITEIEVLGYGITEVSHQTPPDEWLVSARKRELFKVDNSEAEGNDILAAYQEQLMPKIVGPGMMMELYYNITDVSGQMPLGIKNEGVLDRYITFLQWHEKKNKTLSMQEMDLSFSAILSRSRTITPHAELALQGYLTKVKMSMGEARALEYIRMTNPFQGGAPGLGKKA